MPLPAPQRRPARHLLSAKGSRRATAGLAVMALAAGGLLVASAPAQAVGTILTVNSTADVATNFGACGDSSDTTPPATLSLREATCLANNVGGTVTIDVNPGHYTLTNGELQPANVAGQNVSLVGLGTAATTIIDGNRASRVLDLDAHLVGGIQTSISHLTITRGADDTFGGAGIIGGSNLNSTPDSLALDDVVITDNHANVAAPGTTNKPGGAVQFEGGQVTITDSTISNNSAGSSAGSGVQYMANGLVSPEGLSISNTTFSGNFDVASGSDSQDNAGGALHIEGAGAATYSIADSRFTGNTVTAGAGTGTAIGAAIWSQGPGTLDVTGTTFTGNSASSADHPATGGAVEVGKGSANFHYDRFTGNAASAGSAIAVAAAAGAVSATDNWWGCNTGANGTGCDTTSGAMTTAPYLRMTASASPSHVVGPSGSATITASLLTDSVGAAVSASNLTAFDTLPVSFSDPAGDATVTSSAGAHSVALSSGVASIDYHSNTTFGPDNDSVTLDNATTTAVLEVDEAPAITSADSANLTVGTAASFTVTTSGYPAPALTESGSLPPGTTFHDNGNGTATISGTPTGGGGSYPIDLTANNGVDPNATQTLTLDLGQPPTFTSGSTATFRIGSAGSFTVTTSGLPTVSTITESGSLPPGVTFTDNGNGTATITGTPTGAGNTYPVTLTAANGISPNGTQNLTIQVNQAPAVTTNPTDQVVNPGTSVSFTAAASGVPTPTVQWQRSTDGGASFTNVAGATSTTYTFTAAAGDNGNEYRAVFTNVVSTATTTAATLSVGTAPAFTSADHGTFVVGQAGSFAITTSGVPSATLSRTGAQFPAWLTLTDNGDGTGTLTGTPPAGSGGSYQFTLKAANGFSPSASQTYTLFVDQSPVITSADHDAFTVGAAGSFAVTTTAGYPTTTAISKTGALPSGVTFVDNGDGTATLAGTPALGTGGTYPITISASATGGLADRATQNLTLTVNATPSISSADHATFDTASAGSFTVTTTAGYPAATALTQSGSLPSGVTFTDNGDGTATVAGTPVAGTGGVYTLDLKASNGIVPDATQTFTLTVTQSPAITSSDHATFVLGTAGAFTVVTVPGQPANDTITESGALPGGISFTDNGDGTATLGGTPTAGGSYAFTITASNGVLPDATQSFTLTVNAPPSITSADHTTFAVGSAGTFAVTTTAGVPASTTLTRTGSLPAGVTFTDNGDGTATIAGTPAAGTGGSYSLTVTASNGVARDATQSFTLTVTDVPVVTSADHATFAIGTAGTFTVTSQAGYPAATTVTEVGTLPTGVSFTDNGDGTATLAGTPADGTAGSYPLTITATNAAGHSDQAFTLTVSLVAQTITFHSSPPSPAAVVGQTYDVDATGGASPNAVILAIDATSSGTCTITGATVTFVHPGTCLIDASQAGDGTYAAAANSQAIPVTKADTTTTLTVAPTTLSAVVAPVAPGAGTPTGLVTFAVGGDAVGTQPLVDGTATLNYAVAPGAVRTVSATYSGDADYTGSSDSTARHDPTIIATVTSSAARSHYGWYHQPVTITFHCTADGAALTAPCPAAVTLSHDGAGQSVTRTIHATDGGAATVTVSGINVDRTAPTVSIRGVRSGAVYAGSAPAARCVATDKLSGVASCRIVRQVSGDSVRLAATATDKAGNVRSTSMSYRILHAYMAGVSFTKGAFNVREGHVYTLVVLTTSKSRPRFYNAAPKGHRPRPAGPYFHRAGTSGGLHEYVLAVRIDRGLGRYPLWVLGVRIGKHMIAITFRPHR